MSTTCLQTEYLDSIYKFKKYQEDGYPYLDGGMETILVKMLDKGFAPRWCCSGHPENNEDPSIYKSEGYLSFVTMDPLKAFSWFLEFKKSMEAVNKDTILSYEFDNYMVSLRTGSMEDGLFTTWSVCFRWDAAHGKEPILAALEESITKI